MLLIFLHWHYLLVQAYFLASRGRRLKKIMYLRALLTDIFPRKIVTLHPLFLLTYTLDSRHSMRNFYPDKLEMAIIYDDIGTMIS